MPSCPRCSLLAVLLWPGSRAIVLSTLCWCFPHGHGMSLSSLCSFSCAAQDIQERDARDASRATAPLKPAPDAHCLDSSYMGEPEVLQEVLKLLRAACPWLFDEQAGKAAQQTVAKD